MARRGEELANRFKAALDWERAEQERREAERRARLEEGRAAREELFEDLAAFAEAVGHLAVQRQDEGLTLRYNDRFLHLEPMGEGERVKVRFDGQGDEEHRLYREPELADRWVWSFRRRSGEDRLPLFDTGLEELLVRALDLPRPGDVLDDESPQPTLDDAVPRTGEVRRPPSDDDDRVPGEKKRTL